MPYLLHLCYASGKEETIRFASRFDRSLWVIALASQPIVLRIEDPS